MKKQGYPEAAGPGQPYAARTGKESHMNEDMIREIVKKVLAETNNSGAAASSAEPAPAAVRAPERVVDPSGIISIKGSTVELEPFEGREDVRLKDLASVAEAPRIGCGLMELRDRADFEWTLSYDEWDVILEGRLEIVIDGRTVGGSAGDAIYIPKGSHIHFTTPYYARFAYVVYPADWAG